MEDVIEVIRESEMDKELYEDTGETFYFYTVRINGWECKGWARSDQEAVEDAQEFKRMEEEGEGEA